MMTARRANRPLPPRRRGLLRPAARLAAAGAVALALVVPSAGPASATAYRFWTYWSYSGGSWHYSTTGPSRVPEDGAVEGWRFEVSLDSGGGRPPRATGAFERVCGSTPVAAGRKRVAVVVDYGLAADAPRGSRPPRSAPRGFCAVLAPSANSYAALASGAGIRADDGGLVCALDGYPARGCGEPVEAAPAPAPTRTASAPAATSAPPRRPATTTPPTPAVRSPLRSSAASSAPGVATGGTPSAVTASGAAAATPASTPPPSTGGASAAGGAVASTAGSPLPEAEVDLALGASARPVATTSSGGSGTLTGLLVGLVLLVLVGGGAVLRGRVGRRSP